MAQAATERSSRLIRYRLRSPRHRRRGHHPPDQLRRTRRPQRLRPPHRPHRRLRHRRLLRPPRSAPRHARDRYGLRPPSGVHLGPRLEHVARQHPGNGQPRGSVNGNGRRDRKSGSGGNGSPRTYSARPSRNRRGRRRASALLSQAVPTPGGTAARAHRDLLRARPRQAIRAVMRAPPFPALSFPRCGVGARGGGKPPSHPARRGIVRRNRGGAQSNQSCGRR